MEQVTITLLSREPHLSQVLTGFTMLARQNKLKICIEDRSQDESTPHRSVMALVSYRGKTMVYDMLDGYQHADAIRYHLDHCDCYFKRSFSASKNEELGLRWEGKMFPFGFNYHVSCLNHPMDKPFWKESIKKLLGIEHNMFCNTYYTPGRFRKRSRPHKIPQVLFLTRLWAIDPELPAEIREERVYINKTRIDIIRRLRAMEGKIHFVGGLPDTDLAQNMAPDLIMPPSLTNRRNYMKCLAQSDICIGTMGLHESIGWKTGEYITAGKAIVNEKMHYSVPGNFSPGEHYLEFETADECLEAVQYLLDHPQMIEQMKQANKRYYKGFLQPDIMIANSLKITDTI